MTRATLLTAAAIACATAAQTRVCTAQTHDTPPLYVTPQPAQPTTLGPPPLYGTVTTIEAADPAVQLPSISVPATLQFSVSATPPPTTDPRFHQRFTRIALSTLVSLGATLVTSSITAGAASLVVSPCSWCGQTTSIVVAVSLAAASPFAVSATYLLAANRMGARGSYWATLGGFAIGALVGGGIAGLTLALSNPWAPSAVALAFAATLPFVGQAIGYELSAQPVNSPADRSSARLSVHPSLALGRDGNVMLAAAGEF